MKRSIIPLLTLLLCSIPCQGNEDNCPDGKGLYPCFCTSDYTGFSSVVCDKVSDMAHLKKVMELSKGKKVSFDFENVRFGEVPSDFFKGQVSTSLNFNHCKIGSFGDKPFSGLEDTLTRLTIYGSVDKRVKDLETFPLAHLKKLDTLMFEANDIKRLGNDWFNGGPTSLTYISLQANDIEELGDKAFASLENLEHIWLGDNRFKVAKRSMFPRPANQLTDLEMSFNGIESFPEDMFDDMPKVKSINVSGNKFTSLPESVWGRVWNQLEEVYVGRSQLVCDEKIKWIFERKLPKILDGSCAGYNALRGKKLEELTLKDFQ